MINRYVVKYRKKVLKMFVRPKIIPVQGVCCKLTILHITFLTSLRTADAFPEGEKRRPEMRLLFAGYFFTKFSPICGPLSSPFRPPLEYCRVKTQRDAWERITLRHWFAYVGFVWFRSIESVSRLVMNMSGRDLSKFRYDKAIVCGIPSSLPAAAQRQSDCLEPVNLSKALNQHANYVRALKNMGLQVIELTADEQYPDCVFVEDAAVVCGDIALVCRLGHPTRRGESDRMKTVLQELGLSVEEMEHPATLDGGDVLFTGKEFLVGLSERTNEQGVHILAETFSDYPVTAISVSNHLHLKSLMSMAGPDTVMVGGSSEADDVWNEVEKKAKFKYEKLTVPEDKAANCLFVNGTLFHLTSAEIPRSYEVFKKLPTPKIEVENSELHKVDGGLTCLSILI